MADEVFSPLAFSLTGSWDRHFDICTSSHASVGAGARGVV